jgi:hypothetical protein
LRFKGKIQLPPLLPYFYGLNLGSVPQILDYNIIDAWPQFEDEAAKQLESDPLVMKFKIDVAKLKKTAIESRRRLQIKVIKENF